ncbi:MAG: terpene cyclase/mutase family protein [Planctomycetales bacterium]|nr:terpene cyclase/mutase family protein [Planctomycetales bacterium]
MRLSNCFSVCVHLLGTVLMGAVLANMTSMGSASRASAEETVAVDDETRTVPDVPPTSPEQLQAAIDRGVQFLIDDQNANGSWGSPTKTKGLNIYAPVPGAHHAFRAGTTSLALAALLEVAPNDPRTQASIDKAENWLYEHIETLRRASGDAIYNVWGHGYAIQALVRLHRRHADDAAKQDQIAELIRNQFEKLERYESVDGGWGYYDFRYQSNQPTSSSISFVNGAILVALAEARDIGIDPPKRMVDRAIAATERQKKSDFSYLYGEYLKDRPAREINRPGGSLGRTQCCNSALRMWGDETVNDDVIKSWLYRLYVRNGWLDIGRKRPIPHESWMQVAGYFYYFGHYYAGLCLEQLPEQERGPYQAMLAKLMLDRQEKNGCWWDYPLYDYHRAYGTGFALMTLHRCRRQEL